MNNKKNISIWATALSAVAMVLTSVAADVSGRKMVWAHYVPWLTPDNASQMVERFYDFPQCEVGSDPFRAEVLRALDQGIDGFFNDMVAHEGGATSFWDLRPFLKAAEGTPFQFGICLDAKIPVEQQVRELVKMLSTYGDHPNYPKWKDRYIISTYTYFAWSPEEWREIRRGCSEAGYPIWVIANVEQGFTAYSDEKLLPYAGLFEGAYYFSINGAAWANHKSLEQELQESDAFCKNHGAMFMPCLWPGYYGGWLNGRCSYYQPFRGFDTLLRRYDCAQTLKAQWLHITTWNDHDETTLQTRRLTTANPAMIRAMSREFKGEEPAKEAEIQFAYLRETLVGSLLRIEAVRLPAAEKGAVTVCGRLLDINGHEVCALASRQIATNWGREEWLVPTANLAATPALVPEFTVSRRGKKRTFRLPAAFLVTTCLKNGETVKVSERDRREIDATLQLCWKDGVLEGTCALAGSADLKRAVLYCNELPVTYFARKKETVLPVFFSGQHEVKLSVKNGRIAQAVKSFEKNGSPHFDWNEQTIVSRCTPGWMRFTARIETSPETELAFSTSGSQLSFKPFELLKGGELEAGPGRIRLASDGTMYDMPPLGTCNGELHLSVWSKEPRPTDAYWVEFEFADGTFGETLVRYPFSKTSKPVVMEVIETPVTLDHTSSASGMPDDYPFLTSEANLPVSKTRVVKTKVSPYCFREERFEFGKTTTKRPVLPQRRWPMGTFRMTLTLTPLAKQVVERQIITKNGWNEGPEFSLLADGRIKGTLNGGSGRGITPEFSYEVVSRQPLPIGQKSVIDVERTARQLALYVNGQLQQRVDVPPLRSFGNLSPALCDGVNGEGATIALVHDLEFTGNPATVAVQKSVNKDKKEK